MSGYHENVAEQALPEWLAALGYGGVWGPVRAALAT